MADNIREILNSKTKHKEQVEALTRLACSDEKALGELFELMRHGSKTERGTAAEVFKFVSQENPAGLLPYLDTLIEHINDPVPRVRWGCPEAIGNLAQKYPAQVEAAVPNLLKNLEDPGTVVRWCAAFALAEIARYNLEKQGELAGLLRQLSQAEANNGVRNVYLKALKAIDKQKPGVQS